MSTATAFKYHRPFPFCPATSFSTAGLDVVEVPLADAMALFWNLENLSFDTTCTKGSANINWTTTFGATESLPFTPNSTDLSLGAYYNGGTPATAPRSRVCYTNSSQFVMSRLANYVVSGTNYWIVMNIRVADGSTAGYIKIAYTFTFYSTVSGDYVIIRNPNSQTIFPTITGTAPSSGTFTIMGISFDWVGGGVNGGFATPSWRSETATLSCTSSAFTY